MGSDEEGRALHTSNHSMDDLSAIQNLQFQEGFDDVHSSISRREQIRNTLAARASSFRQLSPANDNNAEDKLLQIIMSQTSGDRDGTAPSAVGGPPISPLSRKRSTSRRRAIDGTSLEKKLSSRRNSSAPSIVVLRDDGDDRSLGNSSRHSHRQRRTGTKREGGGGRESRSGRTKEGSERSSRSRSRSRRRSQSPRRSSSVGRRSSSVKRLPSVVSTSSSRKRSDSVGRGKESVLSDDDNTANSSGRDRRRRRGDSRSARRSSSLRPSRHRSDAPHNESWDDLNKSLKDLGVAGLYAEDRGMRRNLSNSSIVNERKSRSGGRRAHRRSKSADRQYSDHISMTSGNESKSFLESALDNFMVDINASSNHTGMAESTHTGFSSQNSHASPMSNQISKTKKTKLEKIHELQAKCDRYKKEWSDASKDKRYYRKELDANKLQVVSLTKKVETHLMETSILQKNLSEALQQLETTQEEQRKERAELSNAAKDLAQARIDHAKSVNDCRELQSQLDRMEGEMKEKDRQIQSLQEDLNAAKAHVENLEADLLYADEQITKLEDDIKRIEEEVAIYREVANRENGEHDGEKLREVRDEMEQRMFEEREKRLEEKQRKLEEKMKQFEEEKERHQEQQAKKEQEMREQLAEDSEKLKSRDEGRQKLDDEINDRLKKLGDDNAALQGRLKSEQLDAAAKIKKKDVAIEELQKEIAKLKEDARSTGVEALQQEIEIVKTTAGTTQAELEDALKQNKMLQEEVSELKTVNTEMKTWVVTLEDVTIDQKKIIDYEKGRMEEWRKKAGDWSAQTHKWKEKADVWEKKAKTLDPNATPEETQSDLGEADPQALFLAAAVEKKKAADAATTKGGSTWKFGGIFQKSSAEVADEAQGRIEELEIENTKQSVEIKTLKSEMVQMKSAFKEEIYTKEQECEKLRKDNEVLEVKSTNLSKELELARRLNQSMDAGVYE
jgi:hypothetical protein